MNGELKACPFCGSTNLDIFDGGQVICQNDECNAINADPYDYCYPNVEQWNTRPLEDAANARAEAAEARAERLQAALYDIYEACYAADCDGELDSRIDGDILDAARLALKGGAS